MTEKADKFKFYEQALTSDLSTTEEVDLMNEYAWELGRIDPAKSMKLATKALDLAEQAEYVLGTTQALRNLAQCYRLTSDFAISLEMCLKALWLSEPNSPLRAEIVNLLGAIYVHEGDYDEALENYHECVEINQNLGNTLGAIKVKNSIGDLFLRQRKYEKALVFFKECLESEETDDTFRGIVLYNLGESLFYLKEHDEARAYLRKAMEIGLKLNFKLMTVYCEALLGEIFMAEDNTDEALKHLLVALNAAEEVDSKERSYRIHKQISECYKTKNNPTEALKHYECFHEIKEHVFNEEKSKKIKNLQFQFESEAIRRETEIERIKNSELKQAYDQIEEQTDHIISSINYARRIQQSILPSTELLDEVFNEHFILYLPKDIVSGDFYWLHTTHDWVYWAVVDCTGHGVPGAFMSILGIDGLNKIVVERGITEPAEILHHLTDHVVNSIKKTSDGHEVKDGMDMALCAWNRTTGVLKFAGAYNPMYLLRAGEITIFKGSKRPIGKFIVEFEVDFEQHEIQLQDGDMVFIFTDGYSDQFGGHKALKFSYQKFRKVIINNASKSAKEYYDALLKAHIDWKGDGFQIDDICVMGVRF